MNHTGTLRLCAALAGIAALAGCAASAPPPITQPFEAHRPAPPPSDPVLAFVASAADGTARALVDPLNGAVTEVTSVSTYFAASGRTCKRYQVLQRPAPRETRLACKSATGGWMPVPALVNPDLRGS